MKKVKVAIIISCILSSLCLNSVNAEFVNRVSVSDFEKSIITISGEIPKESADEGQVFFSFLKDGIKIENQVEFSPKDGNIQFISVNSDGTYTYSFKMSGETGEYNIFVKSDNLIYDEKFNFKCKKDVDTLVDDFSDGKIEKDKIFDKLNDYSLSMSIDLSSFKSQDDIKRLNEQIFLGKDDIKKDRISAIKEIVEFVKGENKLIYDIKDTVVYTEVYKLLSDTVNTTKIDFARYNQLSDTNKIAVCNFFVGKDFKSAKEIKKVFDENVDKYIGTVSDIPTHTGGGSSGGGGNRSFDNKTLLNENTKKFDDIDDVLWAKDAIVYLSDKKIINGIGENKFNPNGYLTREEFAKIISLGYSLENKETEIVFSDVKKDEWYYSYVCSSKNAGLMNGISENDFGVGQKITRQDVAVILYRASTKNGKEFTKENKNFSDFSDVSDYAVTAVSYMSGEGIIKGNEKGEFMPKEYITRAEVAKLIYSLIGGTHK